MGKDMAGTFQKCKALARMERVLAPHPCWGVQFHPQLNLSLNFGKPSLKIREPMIVKGSSERVSQMYARRKVTVRGQWWLWMYCCQWRLSKGDDVLATSSSSIRRIENAVLELDGQKLSSLSVKPDTGATQFEFDLGCRLECRRFEKSSTSDLWLFYEPREMVTVVRGNGTYARNNNSGPDFTELADVM